MTIKNFIIENINLPPEIWRKAISRATNIEENLKSIKGVNSFSRQGSFSRKTVVRPKREGEEFDVDITINSEKQMNNLEIHEYAKEISTQLKEIYNEKVSQFGSKPSKATQVTFNKEFHVDVVPLNIRKDGEFIYDTIKREIIKSNPLELTKKFNENSKKHPNDSLRDTVKLIKYIRNLESIKLPSIIFDVFYSQQKVKSLNYDQNIIKLLIEFQNIPPYSVQNPFCENEVIKYDEKQMGLLKHEIENLRNKLEQNDFSGLKKRFKSLGVTFGTSIASASSIAKTLGSGSLHVSSNSDD